MTTADKGLEHWASFYKESFAGATDSIWPSETLIRLFKGDYIPGLDRNYKGRKVLDVGFGDANNLLFLASLGLSLSGTEINEDVCNLGRSKLARFGISADLKPGFNRKLPFEDNQFDFLVSWNVLHYEPTETQINEAICEYRRVLKPGGRLFLSTTGPEHKILNGSTTVGAHQYRIGREDDFRKGQVFFYFDAPNYVHHYFSPYFKDVLVGRTHDVLFTGTLDWFIVTGVKG